MIAVADAALEPRPAARRLGQLRHLIAMELRSWRYTWKSLVLTSSLAPIVTMLGLSVFAREAGETDLGVVLTGAIVLSVMFGNLDKVQTRVMYMRTTRAFDHLATLPVHRHLILLSVVLAFFVLSVPAIVATILVAVAVGHRVMEINIPLVLVTIPLAALPMAAIGALIGAYVRNSQEGSAISLLLTVTMTGLGHVIVPVSRMPDAIAWVGYVLPSTYAASLFRAAMIGPITASVLVDAAVLVVVGGFLYWVMSRRLKLSADRAR